MPKAAAPKPADVRSLAVDVVRATLDQGAWLRAALATAGRGLDGAGRARLHDLATGTVRWAGRLDATLAAVVHRRPDPWVRALLRVALYQIERGERVPPPLVVSESVGLARRVKGPRVAGWVNAVLRAALVEIERPERFAGVAGRADALAWPPWLLDRLGAALGPDTAWDWAEGLNRPATVDLRVNGDAAARDALLERLAGEGRDPVALPDLPAGLALAAGRGAFDDEGFGRGGWIAQDRSSQRVGALIAPWLGGRVLDACSGGGVKLLSWAAAPGVSEVVALDRDARKLARSQALARRWWPEGPPVPVAWLAADASATGLPDGAFDAVVVDAPCSGTGTIRRRPEIKWRLTPQAVEGLVALQGALLDEAARLVRPGGLLVWVVCSLLPEEGPGAVDALRIRFPALAPLDGSPAPFARWQVGPGAWRLFDPGEPGDGFYAAALRKG